LYHLVYAMKDTYRNIGLSFCFAIALGTWAISSPVGSSADEDFHLQSIWCGDSTGGDFCTPNPTDSKEFLVPAYIAEGLSCVKSNPGESAACQLSKASTEIESTHLRSFGLYPGQYYSLMQRTITADSVESVLRIRVLNASIFILLMFALLQILDRTRPGHQARLGILFFAVPPAMFLLPSVNPSSWGITGISFFAAALLGVILLSDVAPRPYRMSLALLLAVSGLLAVSARTESWIFIVFVCLSVILARASQTNTLAPVVMRIRASRLRFWLILAVLFSMSTMSRIPDVFGVFVTFNEPTEGPSRASWRILVNNIISLPDFVTGFVGGGTWNVSAHQRFYVPLISIVGFTVGTVLLSVYLWRGTTHVVRLSIGVIFVFGAMFILVVHQVNGFYIGKIVQPRYLLPLFLSALLALAVGSTGVLPSRLRTALVVIFSVSHSVVLYQHLRRYVIGLDEYVNDDLGCIACSLRPHEWWWPSAPSPEVVWITGSISFGLFTWFVTATRNSPGTQSAQTLSEISL